jgi:hypothetical protein
MPGTRTIWRAGFWPSALGVGSLALIAITGCRVNRGQSRRSESPQVQRVGLPASAAAPLAAEAAPIPSAITRTLQELHEQRLELPPPSVPPQRLEFGPGRLLQALDERVLLRDTEHGEVAGEASIGAVLALSHGSDGALFALGMTGGVRFESHASRGRVFPHAAFFPGSTLFPDLENPSQFYVYYPSEQELLRYPFESDAGPLLAIEARIAVAGCRSAPTQLLDGALACRTRAGFARRAPRGKRTDFELAVDLGQPFRLLPAKRLDELYSIDPAGQVKRVRLVSGTPVLSTFQLPASPFAAAANAEVLAFVLVSAPEPGKERRWSLLVTDFDGQIQLRVELGSQPARADEDWVKTIGLDKNLALSRFEPLVAVGGAEHVTVWDYHSGKPRFSR